MYMECKRCGLKGYYVKENRGQCKTLAKMT